MLFLYLDFLFVFLLILFQSLYNTPYCCTVLHHCISLLNCIYILFCLLFLFFFCFFFKSKNLLSLLSQIVQHYSWRKRILKKKKTCRTKRHYKQYDYPRKRGEESLTRFEKDPCMCVLGISNSLHLSSWSLYIHRVRFHEFLTFHVNLQEDCPFAWTKDLNRGLDFV